MPVEFAEIVVFLGAGHRRIGIGSVFHARADAADAGGEIGGEEQAVKIEAARGLRHGRALEAFSEDRVDNRRMAGGEHPPCLVRQRRIDPRRHFLGIGLRRQLLGLFFAEQTLARDVAAQHHRARRRGQVRRQHPRQHRLAGAR